MSEEKEPKQTVKRITDDAILSWYLWRKKDETTFLREEEIALFAAGYRVWKERRDAK